MPAALATAVEPAYEAHLRRHIEQAYVDDAIANQGQGPTNLTERARHFADVAMGVLASEIDNGMAWGVGCTACAYYLDRIVEQYEAGTQAGARWFARQMDKVIQEARQWTEIPIILDQIEIGVAGILRRHDATPGVTFPETLPQPATPTLADR